MAEANGTPQTEVTTGEPDDPKYEVEQMTGFKMENGVEMFQIKWKGFEEQTWEPAANIGQGCEQLMADAKKKYGGGDESDGSDRSGRNNKRRGRSRGRQKKKRKRRSKSHSSSSSRKLSYRKFDAKLTEIHSKN